MEEFGFMDITTLVAGITPSRSATFTATVIIAGIGIVLFTLFVLILVFYAFGAIVSKTQGAAKKNSSKKLKQKQQQKVLRHLLYRRLRVRLLFRTVSAVR